MFMSVFCLECIFLLYRSRIRIGFMEQIVGEEKYMFFMVKEVEEKYGVYMVKVVEEKYSFYMIKVVEE